MAEGDRQVVEVLSNGDKLCNALLLGFEEPRVTRWNQMGGVGTSSVESIPAEMSPGKAAIATRSELTKDHGYELVVGNKSYDFIVKAVNDLSDDENTLFKIAGELRL